MSKQTAVLGIDLGKNSCTVAPPSSPPASWSSAGTCDTWLGDAG